MPPLRVLVVDDEHLMRAALKLFLDAADDIELVAEAADGETAVELVRTHAPDVVLMDLRLPGMTGLEATAAIVEADERIRVLVLTTLATDRAVVEALRAGASGYLVKDSSPEDVIVAVRRVAEGDVAISPQLARALVTDIRSGTTAVVRLGAVAALTPREHSVVQLLAEGFSNAEIGARLGLAEATIKANLGRITSKWELRDRVQVLIRATQLGMV